MSIKASVNEGIGTVTLNSPPLNILTREMMTSLRDELERLGDEPSLRVLLLSSEGKHFSAGADVGEHMPPEHEQMIPEFLETVSALYTFPLPVLAAVHGRCLGGGFELVQAADAVVAGAGATFGQPEIVLGVFPPAACALLPALTAASQAAEVVFTGDPIGAPRACEIGVVNRVVADDRVMDEALELARRIARHSGAALRATKQALRCGSAAARSQAFAEAGRVYLDGLMKTEDAVEGLQAFLEKRQPTWKHR